MDNYIYAKNSVEFVAVGVEFCAFLERTQELTQEDFTSTAVKLLPLLYLKATLLPIGDDEEYLDTPERFVSEEDYEYLRGNIERLMGENDAYLMVQSADMQYSDMPLAASIAEDMADIYQIVKDFTSAYRTENEDTMRSALAMCREEFADYWGGKLLNALGALHRICFTLDLNDDGYEYENEHRHHRHAHDEDDNFYQRRQSSWYDDDEDADRWL